MPDQERTDGAGLECLVAAILTTATVESKAHSVAYVINRYTKTLEMLRRAGGALNPTTIESEKQRPAEG